MTFDLPTGLAIAIGGVPIILIGSGKIRAMKTDEAQRTFLQERAKYFRVFGAFQIVCGVAICAIALYLAAAKP